MQISKYHEHFIKQLTVNIILICNQFKSTYE